MKPKSQQQKTVHAVTPELDAGPWTQFWDMHSGGGLKEPWHYIYVQASEAEARVVFYNRFGHNPDRVTCTCCGEDYSVSESKSLSQATAYHRNCEFKTDQYIETPAAVTLGAYIAQEDVFLLPASVIKSDERVGELPRQGYVWQD